MKNVKTMLKIFMDDKQLSAWLKELLRSRDPEFCPVEKACLHAAEGMGGLETLLDLRHRQLVSDLRFSIWQGFKLNLENFRSPLGAAALKLDYTLLPMDGKYNMNVAEAMECAALIGAKHNIPIHMAPGADFDEAIAQSYQPQGQLIVRPSEEIEL